MLTYPTLINRNPALRGGLDDGGTAAADLRQWERDLLRDENLLRIAESSGSHPEDVRRVIEHVLGMVPTSAPWMAYADGAGTRPDTPKPKWLRLGFER